MDFNHERRGVELGDHDGGFGFARELGFRG
jgi:hypothetical protein